MHRLNTWFVEFVFLLLGQQVKVQSFYQQSDFKLVSVCIANSTLPGTSSSLLCGILFQLAYDRVQLNISVTKQSNGKNRLNCCLL